MFDIELKSPEEVVIKVKDRTISINSATATISAGLSVGDISGAGEFEIGEAMITATDVEGGNTMYRVEIGGVTIGVVGVSVKVEDLDELGPIDILATSDPKIVGIIEPKIVIPIGNMDFAELKAPVKLEKRLKLKSPSALPATLEIYKLD